MTTGAGPEQTMSQANNAEAGRAAFARKAWADAFDAYTVARASRELEGVDLERLAIAADLTGRPEESADVWTEAHHQWLGLGERRRAVRCAFWLGMGLMNRGEQARAGSWFARAHELIAGEPDSPEEALLT